VSAEDDRRFMRRALVLAARAEGETNPNPMVGCLIVRAGRIVGEGYHRRAGGPHAEVFALESAGRRARGATMYVTLEPCSVEGRTPPCAPHVREVGIRRVVVATRDPNPRVNGRGLALLRRAGATVEVGLMQAEAEHLNRRFFVAMRRRRPFVLLKAAMTLDGRIATAGGESKWITTAEQRAHARRQRRAYDALLVGIGTVLADDPMLLPEPPVARPFLRVVLDSTLRLPVESRLVRSARRSPVVVFCRADDPRRRRLLEARGVRVFRVRSRDGAVSLRAALRALWALGVLSVMVEGGSEVLGRFLHERLVDEVALYRAPLLLGGRRGRAAFGGPDPRRLSQALRLVRARDESSDLCETWYPEA
jgi:diaminohydroxyphosphoribosylaminopyrimidine deaminase/5-amino-6-(5-phosphoribosylamino)uracil reductase